MTMTVSQAERELLKLDEEIARRKAKASYWRKWPEKKPPIVEYVLQSIDGALSRHRAGVLDG